MLKNRRSVRRTATIFAVSGLVLFTTSGCAFNDWVHAYVDRIVCGAECGF